MHGTGLKHGIAVAEILLGSTGVVISAYFLIELQLCNPSARLCAPLTMLPVVLLLVPGACLIGAGYVSMARKQVAFWKVQLLMLVAVSLYFGLLATWIYLNQG